MLHVKHEVYSMESWNIGYPSAFGDVKGLGFSWDCPGPNPKQRHVDLPTMFEGQENC